MNLFRRAKALLSTDEPSAATITVAQPPTIAQPQAPDAAPRHLLVPAEAAGDAESDALRHRAANALVGKHLKRPDPGPVDPAPVALAPEPSLTHSSAPEPSPEPAPEPEWCPVALAANRGKFFQSPTPVGKGFILEREEAKAVLNDWSIPYSDVVRPYLTSEDLAEDPRQQSGRWIIDFGQRELDEAGSYPRALAIIQERVKPERDTNADESFRTRWWLFGRPRLPMRAALDPLKRYAVLGSLGRRMIVAWAHPWIVASNSTMIFAGDDDYSMGILLSGAYDTWARAGTLEGDLRNTPTAALATFPWPDPVDARQREAVSTACVTLYRRRSELCREREVGLTRLYSLGWPEANPDLAELHRRLDEAVADAYGWDPSIAADQARILERLLQLNREVAEGRRPYSPFPAAG
ncbi:type IIL restriction-modification enzyme MmeI [Cryobacterium sp. TMT2-23]|uniref:type IIL restriction-modification enzyme MmeI n=1 Tax=Cryobacterium sp. TMT2-23 TaxID=1259252 RepID=UPI00106B03B0|nr:type IIL restriction-modification enzyme MmeI [Cryobacterium sp. TMT2-23]TFD17173.1 hypothetical protein E3T32_14295 [Cryobacterium sp. TMT2-23]